LTAPIGLLVNCVVFAVVMKRQMSFVPPNTYVTYKRTLFVDHYPLGDCFLQKGQAIAKALDNTKRMMIEKGDVSV